MMSDTHQCTCAGAHSGHLCVLESRGLTEQIAQITDKPTVVCFTCGREANCAENVCNPMPIEKDKDSR